MLPECRGREQCIRQQTQQQRMRPPQHLPHQRLVMNLTKASDNAIPTGAQY